MYEQNSATTKLIIQKKKNKKILVESYEKTLTKPNLLCNKKRLKVRTKRSPSKLSCAPKNNLHATKKCSCASKKEVGLGQKVHKKSLDRVERKRGGPRYQPTVTNQLVTYYNEPKQNNT